MAPTSATGAEAGARAGRAGGFTLVELMVVLVVLGLAGAAVALTLPDPGQALDRQVGRLGSHLVRAREEAVLSTRAVEVVVDSDGWHFRQQRFAGWVPLDAGPFTAVAWAPGVRPRFAPALARASFRFDPLGGAQPTSLVVADGSRAIDVSVDGHGRVRVTDAGIGGPVDAAR